MTQMILLAAIAPTSLSLALVVLAVVVLGIAATVAALHSARLVSDLRRREGEQAALNQALRVTTEQLRRLDHVKTEFVTIASHELRTPLAQLHGYTALIQAMNQDSSLDPDELACMTASMESAAHRLDELISAMLDVSQLDVDAMDLHLENVAVAPLMRTAIEPLAEAIRQRKLLLTAHGLGSLPPIQADSERLAQAFRNVVVNAVKYTPDGGRIEIWGERRLGEVLIGVRDSGIGIDPANHELIFTKFFRTQDSRYHSTGATKFMGAGPGLGLTIARGVLAGHGGRIWVESAGHDPTRLPGSTFYILLPLVPPPQPRRTDLFGLAAPLARQRVPRLISYSGGR